MEAPRIILFRAKRIDNGKWVEGYYVKAEGKHFIIKYGMICGNNDFLSFDDEYYEIDPTTLSQFTGWKDSHENRIFENDVVEMVSSPKSSYKYLIWWNREMNCMEAIDFRDINFNGHDYWSYKVHRDYETFCLMMQDPWGDFQDIKVIGNLFDNYDIVKEALNE